MTHGVLLFGARRHEMIDRVLPDVFIRLDSLQLEKQLVVIRKTTCHFEETTVRKSRIWFSAAKLIIRCPALIPVPDRVYAAVNVLDQLDGAEIDPQAHA